MEEFGSKTVKNISTHKRIAWVYGHEYIYILENNQIHSLDTDGDNKNLIVESKLLKDFITGGITEEIVTMEVNETGQLNLIKYSLH